MTEGSPALESHRARAFVLGTISFGVLFGAGSAMLQYILSHGRSRPGLDEFTVTTLGAILLSAAIVASTLFQSRWRILPWLFAIFGPSAFAFLLAVLALWGTSAKGTGGYAAEQGMDVLVLALLPRYAAATIPYWVFVAWFSRRALSSLAATRVFRLIVSLRGATIVAVVLLSAYCGRLVYRRYQIRAPARAIHGGNIENLKVLLEGNTLPPGIDLGSLLIQAVEERRPEAVSLLLQRGANPLVHVEGVSPLLFAARNRSEELSLAIFGAETPTLPNEVLEDVVARGDLPFLIFLLNHAVLPPRDEVSSALHLAIRGRHDDILDQLLSRWSTDLERVERSSKRTPLMEAAHLGEVRAAERLLAGGANPRTKDADGHTADWWAEKGGHTELGERIRRAPSPYAD